MILTEQEARTKQCRVAPLTPAVTLGFGGAGSFGTPTFHPCAASACMAWDFEDDEFEYRAVDAPDTYNAPPLDQFTRPEGEGWEIHGKPFNPSASGNRWRVHFRRPFGGRRRGFCGLARRNEVVVTQP